MQVLIPAAGMGKRLGDETQDKTKAMVVVNGKTLIEHCLDAVSQHPIERIILIVGYQKEKLKNFLGSSYKGVNIIYVENDIYDQTNNIYSIFLAKELLSEDDTILIESDLIFDSKILSKLIENPTKNLVLVEKHKPWMDGTVVKLDNDFTITHFVDKSQFDYSEISDYYKTVNLGKWTLPVAVEYSSLSIMDGHHRFNAGKSIGFKRIPCYLLDYSSSGISLKSWRPDWDIKVSDVFKLIKSGKKFPKKTTRHLFDPPLDEVSIPLTLLF